MRLSEKQGQPFHGSLKKRVNLGFRSRETVVIDELTSRHQLGLGYRWWSGDPSMQIAAFLKPRGIVVYLYTPVEIQLQRTYRDKNRPLLQVENPEQKSSELLSVRDPLYS